MKENVLNKDQIENIKICGKHLSFAIYEAAKAAKIGIATVKLDKIAEEALVSRGCKPSFKDYYVAGCGAYPFSLCISINNQIVHGLPSETIILKDGDILSLDLGAEFKGVNTDMAITVPIGNVSEENLRLIKATRISLEKGIEQARIGKKIGDIGHAIEKHAINENLGIVREYVGHGIGIEPHMWPQIPNFGQKGTGPIIEEGMALAIEPMLTLGDGSTMITEDGWTVKTADHSMAAHFEHTVIIENGKTVVVT
jgi:methionyl aminopeptidase